MSRTVASRSRSRLRRRTLKHTQAAERHSARPDGVPLYLTPPSVGGITYGRLRFDDGYYIVEDAEPAVREMAKRVFPGCSRADRTRLRFRATRRAIGDLNWLMTRYPLDVDDADRYEAHRLEAVTHALRRDAIAGVTSVSVPAAFTGTLLHYQEGGVAHLVLQERTLLADDMGLGKTVEAIAALAACDAWPAVVVAPTSVQTQWCRQLEAFLQRPTNGGIQLCERLTGMTAKTPAPALVYITHYGLLHAWREVLEQLRPRAIVFDEIQELRHTGSYKYSAASILSTGPQYVWGLSGTPIHNYGSEIWAVLNILDFHCMGDYDSFTREWCMGYGNKVVEKPDVLGDHLRREGLMLRRTKAMVQSELPPKRRCVHYIDHDGDVYRKAIAEAQELAAKYAGIRDWHERGQTAARIDQASRRATGLAKAPYAAQFVRSLVAAGERPLVYAWHHDVHDCLIDELKGIQFGQVTGRQSQREKDAAVGAFAQGNLSAMLLSLRATAGLDGLQGKATCVVFVELDWTPAVHSQCEDRLHRIGIGPVDSVLCYYLVSRTGHDTVVMDALGLKIGQFVGLMGDAAPTEEDEVLNQHSAKRHLESVIERLRGGA